MQPKCILVAGNVPRFVDELHAFDTYLCDIGCDVEFFKLPYRGICREIGWIVRDMHPQQTLLLAYNGHGQPSGWEDVSYLSLLWNLLWFRGELMVLNDTCYGYRFLKYLKLVRSPKNTCFISPWDSEEVSCGGPLRDALAYWPRGLMPEQEITQHFYSSSETDAEVPLQLRWGAKLDHRFFPA